MEDDIDDVINFFEKIVPGKLLNPKQKDRFVNCFLYLADQDLADIRQIVTLIQDDRAILKAKNKKDGNREDLIEGLIKETLPFKINNISFFYV
jgi:hypothetical protein